jgi:hypothetical protein
MAPWPATSEEEAKRLKATTEDLVKYILNRSDEVIREKDRRVIR